MSNQGYAEDHLPPFAASQQAPEQVSAPSTSPERTNSDGWAPIVAAIHSVSRTGKQLLLTITAENMSPIWIDFYTQRYYSESPLTQLPLEPLNPKIFAKPVDPSDPPFPWVRWRSIDSLLWSVGELAFIQKRAPWLVLGERYALIRWPNLTEIPYTGDQLRAVSMLANGMLTIDELAFVSHLSVEESQKLVSTLSFMEVLRGTGAPKLPAKVVEALKAEEAAGYELPYSELEKAEETAEEQEPQALEIQHEEAPLESSATPQSPDDAAHFRKQLERPSISSIQLPDLPEDLYGTVDPVEELEATEQTEAQLLQEEPQAKEVKEESFVAPFEIPAAPREYKSVPVGDQGFPSFQAATEDYSYEDYYDEPANQVTEEAEPKSIEQESVEVEAPEKIAPATEERPAPSASANRFANLPSFESIIAQQSALDEALEDDEELNAKKEEQESSGLFGMLKKRLGLK